MTTHIISLFFFNDTATTEIYTLSLHDALPICYYCLQLEGRASPNLYSSLCVRVGDVTGRPIMSECLSIFLEIGRATSELQSRQYLVCRLLLEKKKNYNIYTDLYD